MLEAFHYPFHPLWQRAVEVVASGAIGEVQHVETLLRMPAPPDSDPRWSLELAGGSTMDLGCYALHAQRQLGLRFLGGSRRWCPGSPRRGPFGRAWMSRCRSSSSSRRARPGARASLPYDANDTVPQAELVDAAYHAAGLEPRPGTSSPD